MPKTDAFDWPSQLHAQHAVDQLATMLATSRQQYHSNSDHLKGWTDHTNSQRMFYLEMAERLLIMMGKMPEHGQDLPLNSCAAQLARKLERVK